LAKRSRNRTSAQRNRAKGFRLKVHSSQPFEVYPAEFIESVALCRVERDARDPRLATIKSRFRVYADEQTGLLRWLVRFPVVSSYSIKSSWLSVIRAYNFKVD